MGVGYAGRAQLRAHRRAEVDVDLVLRAPYDDALRPARFRDLSSHVASNLEATSADAGSNRRDERSAGKRVDSGGHYLGDDSAPARVNGGHVAGTRIGQKERNAVCHTHSHRDGAGGEGR